MTTLSSIEQELLAKYGNLLVWSVDNIFGNCLNLVWQADTYLFVTNNPSTGPITMEAKMTAGRLEEKLINAERVAVKAKKQLRIAIKKLTEKSNYVESDWEEGYNYVEEFNKLSVSLIQDCFGIRKEMLDKFIVG
jgi:hypothetical protein